MRIDIVEIPQRPSARSRLRLTTSFGSIDGLARFVLDCKNANPDAGVRVELVCGVGVGDVAVRVTKCSAEQVRDLGQHRTAEQIVDVTVQRLGKFVEAVQIISQ